MAKSETRTIYEQHALVYSAYQPTSPHQNDFAISVIFGEHQVMAQLIAKRVLISPLIHKDFQFATRSLLVGNVASVNLNHQK